VSNHLDEPEHEEYLSRAVGDAGDALRSDQSRKGSPGTRPLIDQCKGAGAGWVAPAQRALAHYQEDRDRRDQQEDAAPEEDQSKPEERRGKAAYDRADRAAKGHR